MRTHIKEPKAALHDLGMQHWPAAQMHWSRFLLLSDPAHAPDCRSVAQINFGSRQVQLNYDLISAKGLTDCLEALLAHEVGHHVRYPATLAVEARLRLLQQTLIPIPGYSVTNLFTDLMINEFLGEKFEAQFVKLYRTLAVLENWEQDPAFLFYLSIYEELWNMPAGNLLQSSAESFEKTYPGCRAEARLLVDKLFNLEPNIYTQFLYFVSVLSRYIKPPNLEAPQSQNPSKCHADEPSPEDWAEALRPNGREGAAIAKGLREGWLSAEVADKLNGKDAMERRIAGLPGMGTRVAEQVPEIMGAYYRREAERYLFAPPPKKILGDALVPTAPEPWEWSEPVKEIDWLETLLESGPDLGPLQPLKRSRIAETEGYDVPLWRPLVEVYLDVSGSMPDPRSSVNAMTLAALILVMAAIRKGGWARALLYSTDHVQYWNWCRSEMELSRFLMHYFGAGTEFPFHKLAQSVTECGDKRPVRVVITDSDFHHNFAKHKNARKLLLEAVRASSPFLLLLHQGTAEQTKVYRVLGAQVECISDLQDFPKMAAKLAKALFENRMSKENPNDE